MPGHLFVYGSLRAGSVHPMAQRLHRRARHVGKARAQGVLYDFGAYPGAIFDAATKQIVRGDVFALPAQDALWKELDAYEGLHEQRAPYHRMEVEVRLDSGRKLKVLAYELTAAPLAAKRIDSGDWMVHLNTRHQSRRAAY